MKKTFAIRKPRGSWRVWLHQWEVTIKNVIDGEAVTWRPVSLNDLKRRTSVIFANYIPGRKRFLNKTNL